MKLNCVSCGHSLDLYDDYRDYEGQVSCYVCGALLTIRTENGQIRSVTLTPRVPEPNDATLHNL